MRHFAAQLFLVVLPLMCVGNIAKAENRDLTLQIKYSPWGTIDADEDDFDYGDEPYQKYELDFERSFGLRAMYEPLYVAANRYTTQINALSPEAEVDTFSIGFGGFNYDPFAYDSGLYLFGAIGAGRGNFKFNDSDMNDWEAFIEANAEVGLRFQQHFLIGIGGEWQHFGEPGESKANYWNLYFSTGFTF